MKAIKIFGVFILILSGVVGVFYLVHGKNFKPMPSISNTTYQSYREQIERDWELAGDWNEQLFLSHRDLLRQLSVQYETTTLNDLNTKTAIEIIQKRIFEEWSSPSCSKVTVDKYNNAIKVVESQDNSAKDDPNVQMIKRVYDVYSAAYGLSHQRVGLSPHYDGSKWNSYSAYSSSMTNKRNSILSNSDYKEYLTNIVDIKHGLEDLPGKLANGRKLFSEELAGSIISYYSQNAPSARCQSGLNELRKTISKYEGEYSSNSHLNTFAKSYANDVFKNECGKE